MQSIFDYIIWNKDRKPANVLIKDGKIVSIDNGLAFDEWWQYLISENLGNYVYDREAPSDTKSLLRKFMTDTGRQDELRTELLQILPRKVIDAMFARIQLIGNLLVNRGNINFKDLNASEDRRGWAEKALKYFPR